MATAASASSGDREVSIGRVFERAFGTLRANPLATLGIAFLCSALPGVLLNYFIMQLRFSALTEGGTLGLVAVGLLSVVIAMVLYAITQGALVRAVTARSEGRTATFAESITAGMGVILPLVGVSILSALGIGFGMILLLVPGIMLYCAWAVASPVVVEERTGPVAALSRSAALTRGARWKVFGVSLILVVAYWLFSLVVGLVLNAFGGFGQFDPASAEIGASIPMSFYIVTAISQTIVACLWGLVLAALYVELRDWKDGPRAEALAEVFS